MCEANSDTSPCRSAAQEKEMQQTVEARRGEREAVERELAGCRVRLEEVTSRSAALEARLAEAETEGRSHAEQVLRETNQVVTLQREVEEWQRRVSSLEESLAREKVRAILHVDTQCQVSG